jgi:lysophospholipase L1-like esterase
VILGDSCSFAWGIDTPDTFFAKLDALQREAGAGLEVLNAAYPGQSAVAGVHMLRELVLPVHPKTVVLGFTGNNAFRFTLVRDAERFRFAGLRRLMLRSRLFHILAVKLAEGRKSEANPRNRAAIYARPVTEQRRVAAPSEFEEALRTMVREARAAGVEPVFLVFPRASVVSTQYRSEDSANLRNLGLRRGRKPGPATPSEINALELSCLEVNELTDPLDELHRRMPVWRPIYPDRPEVRAMLQQGAAAYVAGDLASAEREVVRAGAAMPDSPLAAYDLGVVHLRAGNSTAGLADLDRASHLACSVFLEYQVVLWRVAEELKVPVVDLTLHFQAHDGETLYLDPAHPDVGAQEIIARALWEELKPR